MRGNPLPKAGLCMHACSHVRTCTSISAILSAINRHNYFYQRVMLMSVCVLSPCTIPSSLVDFSCFSSLYNTESECRVAAG